jgi:peptide deformylase
VKLLTWNLSRLKVKSRDLTGPLPPLYVRDLTQTVEMLNGVYLSGIQVGDSRRFAIPNPCFKTFPILYNPVIIEKYDYIKSEGEGCLSFPGVWVHVPRFKFVSVRFMDGSWTEKTATFGSDDQNTEAALLAKAIQHEIYHMDGIVIHDRMTDLKKKLKVMAHITQQSIKQNRDKGAPNLDPGPPELDPSTLPLLSVPTHTEMVQDVDNTTQNDDSIHA